MPGPAGHHEHSDLPVRDGAGAGLGPGASRLTHRAAWLDHDGPPPVIDGTLIRLQADHLPGDRNPKPVWLWCSRTSATAGEVDRWWQAFLRRFDLEMSKPRCCHTCGLSAFSLAPSSAVLMLAS
jgi:hypothetical protein